MFLSRRLHVPFLDMSQFSGRTSWSLIHLLFYSLSFKCIQAQNQVLPQGKKPTVQYIRQLTLRNNRGFSLQAEVLGYHLGLGEFLCLHFSSQGEKGFRTAFQEIVDHLLASKVFKLAFLFQYSTKDILKQRNLCRGYWVKAEEKEKRKDGEKTGEGEEQEVSRKAEVEQCSISIPLKRLKKVPSLGSFNCPVSCQMHLLQRDSSLD